MPSSGYQRIYTSGFIEPSNQYLYIGNQSGEVSIFHIPGKVFKAQISVKPFV